MKERMWSHLSAANLEKPRKHGRRTFTDDSRRHRTMGIFGDIRQIWRHQAARETVETSAARDMTMETPILHDRDKQKVEPKLRQGGRSHGPGRPWEDMVTG